MQFNRPTFIHVFALLGGLLLSVPAFAQVPTQVPFQGLLLDDTSQPVTATVDFDFELFDAVTSGASLWNESHSAVSVVDGVYSVNLGSGTPLTSGILAGGVAFLEITVDGETLAPRQQLLSVPYALRTDQVGATSASYVDAIFQSFEFDGNEPSNLHPDEGLPDVDGDGKPNFLDDDNDGDGILDGVEVANGSDINLVTPTLISPIPNILPSYATTTLEVRGTGLSAVSSVSITGESPVPYNVSDTSFDVDVTAPTLLSPTTLVVTLGNGESASRDIPTQIVPPTISGFSPPYLPESTPSTISIGGTGFFAGTTVTIGTQNLVPTAITPTSITVDVGAEPLGSLPVIVDHPNGTSAFSTINVVPPAEVRIVFVSGSVMDGDVTSAGADALCQNQAGIGGLSGTYKAWLSESQASLTPRSPDADFPQNVGPYVRTDGAIVADDWADLTDGTLQNPITHSHLGGAVSSPHFVWTGTNADGTAKATAASTCDEWTVKVGGASVGFATRSDAAWTDFATFGCLSFARLYCVEQ